MEEKNRRNVLIIGRCAKEYALAQKLKSLECVREVYVAPGNDAMKEFCQCVAIKENDSIGLLEFAMEQDIDLTVVSGEQAIKADVSGFFIDNNKLVFGPTAKSAEICTNKSIGKKFMYRLNTPTASFGIFEKANLALDYVRNSQMPVVVKTDEHRGVNGTLVCSSYPIAKSFIDETFLRGEQRVIVEDFIYGHEFSFYVVTDGYNALPISTVANYKFSLDGDGGLLTPGMGCYAPDYKISNEIEEYIMHDFILPTLDSLAQNETPYVGILGLDAVLTPEGDVVALEYNTSLQEHDCQGILALMDENLYYLMQACAMGTFSDDYERIDMSGDVSVSAVLSSGRTKGSVISGLDNLDELTKIAHFNTTKNKYLEYETNGGRTLLVTRTAKTISRAVGNLYEELDLIEFDGKSNRHDLCLVPNI